MKLKIKLAYWDVSKHLKNTPKHRIEIRRAFTIFDAPEHFRKPYSQYLLSCLESDFFENRFGHCDEILAEIARIESGEAKNYSFETNGFIYYLSRDCVIFENVIYGICPHWPRWSCPLVHFKTALQAARNFFAMPESLDTELIVELPDAETAKVVLFPPLLAERMADD